MYIRVTYIRKCYIQLMYIVNMSSKIPGSKLWLHTCNRCHNKWTSKKQWPDTCANPKCRSPYWSKARVIKYKK